jgi:hypothetical protein
MSGGGCCSALEPFSLDRDGDGGGGATASSAASWAAAADSGLLAEDGIAIVVIVGDAMAESDAGGFGVCESAIS